MDRKNLVDAVKKLNKLSLTDNIDVKNKEEELKENFMISIESIIDNGGESDIPEELIIIYNKLSEEYEQNKNKKETKEMEKKEENKEEVKKETKPKKEEVKKETKPKKEEVKKETKPKKESRPQVLRKKMQSIKSLDKLLLDEELLVVYNNHKSWIKNDYNKIISEK
jgi:colicin import membrane protein